jgi:hypothetical protein
MFNIISGTGFRSAFSRELHKGEVTAAELCRKVLIDNGQENGYIGKWSEAGVIILFKSPFSKLYKIAAHHRKHRGSAIDRVWHSEC